MFVRSVMIPLRKTISVTESKTAKEVLSLLEKHNIDGVPVITDGRYAGIVTRYKIYEAQFASGMSAEDFLEYMKAGDMAHWLLDTVTEDAVFEQTLLLVKDRPLIAVTGQKGELLGIITRSDILEQFQSAFGMKAKGVRISFTSVETEGRIARLSEITRQFHENIISLATFDESDKLVRRIVMKVEKKQSMDKFLKKLEQSGFRILSIHED
ncbi:CBS domain-containing protein [Fictibacillus iocasae]|uniref:CBS domain-containing protein n=1 Tax=Fictibacillus iocasae TaxID=2715437 RepID=A0ABW2NKZ9_9BACL